MKFSRQEYWGRLPYPTLGDLPDPGIEPKSLATTLYKFAHIYAFFCHLPSTYRNYVFACSLDDCLSATLKFRGGKDQVCFNLSLFVHFQEFS